MHEISHDIENKTEENVFVNSTSESKLYETIHKTETLHKKLNSAEELESVVAPANDTDENKTGNITNNLPLENKNETESVTDVVVSTNVDIAPSSTVLPIIYLFSVDDHFEFFKTLTASLGLYNFNEKVLFGFYFNGIIKVLL